MTATPDHGTLAEQSADAIEDAATALVRHLTALKEMRPHPGLDPRAILLGLSRALASTSEAARQLGRQGWFDLDDPVDKGRWLIALGALENVSDLFKEVANGWI